VWRLRYDVGQDQRIQETTTAVYINMDNRSRILQPPSLWMGCILGYWPLIADGLDMQKAKDPYISRTHRTCTTLASPWLDVERY
jgi:hypothetical protein